MSIEIDEKNLGNLGLRAKIEASGRNGLQKTETIELA